MMRCRWVRGGHDAPLVMAYHGLGQRSVGCVSYLPSYWSFPHMSGMLAACKRLGWSCCMPQSRGAVFRVDKVPSDVLRAREKTQSYGKLYLFGFSMGAETVYEAANFLVKHPIGVELLPFGIWGHSGRAPDIRVFNTSHKYRVALSCNYEEAHPLPFNKGRSMRDERKRARDFYEGKEFHVREFTGSARGKRPVHRCDPSLNEQVLQWLGANYEE